MRGTIVIFCALLFVSCNSVNRQEKERVDKLNAKAYSLRYVDVDSVTMLAQEALSLSPRYADGRNEARNNLAFVAYQQMDFDGVDSILSLIRDDSHNHLLLLCAEVMQMKATQRTGNGEVFFAARSRAENHLKRIYEGWDEVKHNKALLVYAQTEFDIITSTYYYYQEQDSLAKAEIYKVMPSLRQRVDTAQWVYYNYMLGSGGLVEGKDAEEITLREFDYLYRAYNIARRMSMAYFEANCLQSFASMFLQNEELIANQRQDGYQALKVHHVNWLEDGEDLALAFCQHALALFQQYDDLFQTACTYRTLGEICFHRGDYDGALENYTQAIHLVNRHHLTYYADISPDTLSLFNPDNVEQRVEMQWINDARISTVPEWIAGIRQQLMLAFSALDMKQASDYNRNAYLDLLQSANQNLELEERSAELEKQMRELRWLLYLGGLLMAVAIGLFFFFRRRLGQPISTADDIELTALAEKTEQVEEQLLVSKRHIVENKRKNAENRAKVSLVHAILPFLDRIGGEVRYMARHGKVEEERQKYITELIDQIEQYNDILTQWIKMEQGQLDLHISTVSIDKLMEIVQTGRYAFDQKGVELNVVPSGLYAKADESLTLFMMNTLADNARKFTPKGGRVSLSAEATEEYVEVRVADTGAGLSDGDVELLMNNKVYDAAKIGEATNENKGTGFGLMNCRGIIEKYKKVSSIFACCAFGVQSKLGEGSTFYFRLPRVMRMLLFLLSLPMMAWGNKVPALCDSVYQMNVEGRYNEALSYADSALSVLNQEHPNQLPLLLLDTLSANREGAELLWAQAGVETNYFQIVELRNEVALAALALHEWNLYAYNNRIFTRLYKFIHQDKGLPEYYHRLEQTHQNSNILLVLILLISLVILVFAIRYHQRIMQVLLHRQNEMQEQALSKQDELSKNEYEDARLYVQNQVLDNCLSTIKHESMYYPSRIRVLVEKMGKGDINQLSELVSYYHHIYTLLCRQADMQVSQPGFKRQKVNVAGILRRAEHVCAQLSKKEAIQVAFTVAESSVETCSVVADEVLLDYLIESLLTGMIHGNAQLTLSAEEDGDFVRFVLRDNTLTLTEEQLANLFYPDHEHISYLVAKQILREHDTYANHPGCRLMAQVAEDGGYEIYFTLLKSK